MGTKRTRKINVAYLARVEGEGGLTIKIRGGEVKQAQLRIFEPPRYFEAFLRGRSYVDAPDLTARICGICPVAYQMSSCHAIEAALGLSMDGPLRELRRLLYCGEWIESHGLHAFMLHAPDFLGYPSAIHMAKDHPEIVETALRLKKLGNDLMVLLGGREIHPVNVRIGGFYRVPHPRELQSFRDPLQRAMEQCEKAIAWCGRLPYPDFERDYLFVALRHPHEYPFNEGRIVSNRGLDIPVEGYEEHFEELQVEHSTALHSVLAGHGPYFVGPLARFNLNVDHLSPRVQQAARWAGLEPGCTNPFKSIIARVVEMLFGFEEALRIIDGYEPPDRPWLDAEPRAGTGCGCTEAPRGMLYHRYQLDDRGEILNARIVPPTSQNQATMEEDLRQFAAARLELPDEELKWQCEQAIRGYDPCISCSVHCCHVVIDREVGRRDSR